MTTGMLATMTNNAVRRSRHLHGARELLAGMVIILGSLVCGKAQTQTVSMAILAEGGPSAAAVVALAETAISRLNDIALVDRTQITRVMAEQELAVGGYVSAQSAVRIGSILECEVIAILAMPEADPDGTDEDARVAGRLTVFDAVTGQRLADRTLSATGYSGLAHAPETVADIIRSALHKRRDALAGKGMTISLSPVGDAGLSGATREVPPQIGELLERLLLAAPEFTVLERRHLEHVNREAVLTGDRRGELLASVVMLDLELGPGPAESELTLTAIPVDRTGTTGKAIRVSRPLDQPAELAAALAEELRKSLNLGELPVNAKKISQTEVGFFSILTRRSLVLGEFDNAARAAAAKLALKPDEKMAKIEYAWAATRAAHSGFTSLDMESGFSRTGDRQLLTSPDWPGICSRLLDHLEGTMSAVEALWAQHEHPYFNSSIFQAMTSAVRLQSHMTEAQRQRVTHLRGRVRAIGLKIGEQITRSPHWWHLASLDVRTYVADAMRVPFEPNNEGHFNHPLAVWQIREGGNRSIRIHNLQDLTPGDRQTLLRFYSEHCQPAYAPPVRLEAHLATAVLLAGMPGAAAEMRDKAAYHMEQGLQILSGTDMLEDRSVRDRFMIVNYQLIKLPGYRAAIVEPILARLGDALTEAGIGDVRPFEALVELQWRSGHGRIVSAGEEYVEKLLAMVKNPAVRFHDDPEQDKELRLYHFQRHAYYDSSSELADGPWVQARRLVFPDGRDDFSMDAMVRRGDQVYLIGAVQIGTQETKHRQPRGRRLYRVDLTSGAVDIVATLPIPEGWYIRRRSQHVFFSDSTAYWPVNTLHGPEILVFPLEPGRQPHRITLDIPANFIWAVARIGDFLYLGGSTVESGNHKAGYLLRTTLSGQGVEVLAASTRRDARSGLDNCNPYYVRALIPSADEQQLLIGADHGIWLLNIADGAISRRLDFHNDLQLRGWFHAQRRDAASRTLWLNGWHHVLVWPDGAAEPILLIEGRRAETLEGVNGPSLYRTPSWPFHVRAFAVSQPRAFFVEGNGWGWFEPVAEGGQFHPLPLLDNEQPQALAANEDTLMALTRTGVWWFKLAAPGIARKK